VPDNKADAVPCERLPTIFVELFSKLEHRILQRRTQQLFMDGGDVVFFSLKKAIDDGFDRSMIKACHDAYFFICIDVMGRKCNFSISPGKSYFATIHWIPTFAGMTIGCERLSFRRRRESSDCYPDLLRSYAKMP